MENAKAINQYSNDSNMILAMKRGLADKTEIQDELKNEMISKLQSRGLSNEKIMSIEEYIENLDFDKPIHENYEIISKYMKEIDIPRNCYPSICTALKNRDSLVHIEDTLSSLNDGLSKARLPESIKLYRAIKTNEEVDLREYIGKSISSYEYTSTSTLYDASFAKYDDFDTVMEIYAPKGTQGSYMSQLSDYDSVEQEILLNPNDIHVMDIQEGVVDKNGRTKTILKGLLLSKDKECYKGIDIKKEETKFYLCLKVIMIKLLKVIYQ